MLVHLAGGSAASGSTFRGCTWAVAPVLGDPCMAAFLGALTLCRFCSACAPAACHVAEGLFVLAACVSPFGASASASWGAVSCRVWRGCRTSVGGGDLGQAPTGRSVVCSARVVPAPTAGYRFVWMAGAFGVAAARPVLGWLWAVCCPAGGT